MKNCNCKQSNCGCDNGLLKLIAIDISQLKNAIEDLENSDRNFYWNNILNKPDVFPPSYHNHSISDIDGLNSIIENKVDKEQNKSLVYDDQISKLSDLDTQSELDAKISQVVAETIPITGTVLPQGPGIPSWVVTNGKAVLLGGSAGKTYTQTGGSLIPVTANYERIAYYNKATNLWTQGEEAPLPINPADGLVTPGETKATSGDAVFKAIQPIDDYIAGVSNFGVIDNTGYVVSNPTEYTRINTLSANTIDGILDRIKVRVSKTGDLKIIFCSKISETSYKIEKLIPVTATVVGNNDFINGTHFTETEIKAEWYEGFIVPTGGALPTNVTKTGGSASLGTNTSVEGDTITVGGSNTEWAVGAYVKSGSLDEKITSKIGESDLTIVTSNNLAKNDLFREDVYINVTTGAKVFSVDWGSYRIYIPKGTQDKISFGNFDITTGGYSAFYSLDENPEISGAVGMVQYNGIHSNSELPKTVNIPQSIRDNGGWLYITVKRPSDNRSKSIQTMVNYGTTLLPYAPAEVITSIIGIPLAGQNSEVTGIGIGNERMEYRSNRKATFSFIFDDINDTDPLVYNIFKEFGFRPSFALKTQNLNAGNRQLYIDYWKDGCSILSHSVTHPSMSNPANITYQQVTDEMVNSKKAIKALGIVVSGWVTPQSVLHSSFLPIVDKVYGYGFTNLNVGNFNTTVHPNRQARFGIEGTDIIGNSLQTIKDRIDLAISNGELINFYAHKLPSASLDVNGDSYLTETKLRDILTYLKAKADAQDCLVLNTDDAVKTYYTQTYSEKFPIV